MTLKELQTKLENEKHIIGALQLKVGVKYESPNVLGIYEEDGLYYVYDTNDGGKIVVLDKGTENEMIDAFYRRILKIEKRYLKDTR